MKLKVISDGTTVGTKIINEESGELLSGVASIDIMIDANNKFVTCNIKLVDVKLELTANSNLKNL